MHALTRSPLLRDRRGQASVELALVLPVLLLLAVGIFEFAQVWRAYQAVTHAAREGARAAAVANPAIARDSVEAVVRNALVGAALDPARAKVQLSGMDGATGTPARVEVRYPVSFTLLQPFVEWSAGETGLQLSTAAVMRNE